MGFFDRLFGRKKKDEPSQPVKATDSGRPAAKVESPRPLNTTDSVRPVEKAESPRPEKAADSARPADAGDSSRPTSAPDFSRLMTSQLAALWLDSGDAAYREEYLRRLRMCKLDQKQAEAMLAFETDMLKAHPRPEMLRADFITQPLFDLKKPALEHPIAHYETNFEYPLSYVIKLSDEAEWHYWNSHEKDLPADVWAEIFALSDKNRKLFLPLALHIVKALNCNPGNVNVFSYHEQGMLDHLRWGRAKTMAASNPWKE